MPGSDVLVAAPVAQYIQLCGRSPGLLWPPLAEFDDNDDAAENDDVAPPNDFAPVREFVPAKEFVAKEYVAKEQTVVDDDMSRFD